MICFWKIDVCCGGIWHTAMEYPGIFFLLVLSRCPAIWIMSVRISWSSSEGIQIPGMRCQPLIASQGSYDDLRWATGRSWLMETWSQEIQQDHTKSWFGLWTSIPLQQMFAPGMAADSLSSITDNLTLRIQRQQLGLGEAELRRTVECVLLLRH